MKKIIIAACMTLLSFSSVFAQKGKQAIGGNLSYGTEIESIGLGLKYQYNITDQIRIEPSMNYFFKMTDLACLTSMQISTTFSHSKQCKFISISRIYIH